MWASAACKWQPQQIMIASRQLQAPCVFDVMPVNKISVCSDPIRRISKIIFPDIQVIAEGQNNSEGSMSMWASDQCIWNVTTSCELQAPCVFDVTWTVVPCMLPYPNWFRQRHVSSKLRVCSMSCEQCSMPTHIINHILVTSCELRSMWCWRHVSMYPCILTASNWLWEHHVSCT